MSAFVGFVVIAFVSLALGFVFPFGGHLAGLFLGGMVAGALAGGAGRGAFAGFLSGIFGLPNKE